jgi:signal transduction histidine kinase
MQVYVFGLLIDWTGMSVPVSVLLWRSGRAQPMLPRRRMRLLGAAALGLNISVIVTALLGAEQSAAMDVIAATIAIVCAALFYLALGPPGALRVWWRRHEEASLQRAAIGVSGATTLDEVTAVLLPPIATMFGAHGAVLIGREHGTIGSYGMDAAETQLIDSHLRGREVPRIESGLLVIPLRSGWLAVKASAYTPFFGREEVELLRSVGAFVDLAIDRAALFAAERRARAEIERANDELESFTYSVSHDLKSPLVALSGYIDYLEEDFGEAIGPAGKQYLERMTTNANYMENLIQDLLELSRVGRLQTDEAEVDLGNVVRRIVLELLSAHPEATIEFGSLPVVWMNPVRARQLFTNLIENAIHHAGREDVHIRVSAIQDGDGSAQISVADDGQGIPADYRERVFRVFERLEPEENKGTGIGLSICEKIVGQMGGRIWVADSTRGTDVRLTIPSPALRGWHMEVSA